MASAPAQNAPPPGPYQIWNGSLDLYYPTTYDTLEEAVGALANSGTKAASACFVVDVATRTVAASRARLYLRRNPQP